MKIYLVTQNKTKQDLAKKAFQKYGVTLHLVDRDYPEIQADSSLEIARYTALAAASDYGDPAIREDHSFFINSLGIPGPYMNYIERKLPVHKLLEIMQTQEDRSGYFEIGTVYALPSGEYHEFVYQVPIHVKKEIVVPDPRGGWNSILCLKGEDRAFTEYPEEERLHIWSKNFEKIAKIVSENLQDGTHK